MSTAEDSITVQISGFMMLSIRNLAVHWSGRLRVVVLVIGLVVVLPAMFQVASLKQLFYSAGPAMLI